MFCQIRLFLLLSPQPTKAQVQTCKSIFQLQMKKQRRLQQIIITKGGRRIILIAAQCTRHCTTLVLWNSPPSLFSTSISVLQCILTTVAIFLNLSLIVDCSIIFILLCLQSHAYHAASFSFSLSIFFLIIFVVTPSCLCPPVASKHLFVRSVVASSSHIFQFVVCLWLIVV